VAQTSARRLEPDARVLVFVDGQNVYKSCKEQHGYAYCHPILLARLLAGKRRLVGVRYYSGIHNPNVDPAGHANVDRRHKLIGRTGVTVIPRQLAYRWEWGYDPSALRVDPRKHKGTTRQVDVSPYQRAREKGIDVALALDVVDLAVNIKLMDVAIVVSEDNDLCEAARVVHAMTIPSERVSVEAAVVNRRKKPVILDHYDYTHQIDKAMFDQMRDGFDYHTPLDKTKVESFLTATRAAASAGGI
jgi:NYN domain